MVIVLRVNILCVDVHGYPRIYHCILDATTELVTVSPKMIIKGGLTYGCVEALSLFIVDIASLAEHQQTGGHKVSGSNGRAPFLKRLVADRATASSGCAVLGPIVGAPIASLGSDDDPAANHPVEADGPAIA